MSRSLNKVMLIGHVGKDPEIRYTGNGTPVCTFSLATSDTWKDKTTNQQQEKTEWHNIKMWSRLAEICNEYVKKGKKLYIEGRIENRSYDDKDGNKKYITEIVADQMIMLDGGGAAGGSGGGGNYSAGASKNNSNGGDRNSDFGGGSNAPTYGNASAPAPQEFEPSIPDDDLPF